MRLIFFILILSYHVFSIENVKLAQRNELNLSMISSESFNKHILELFSGVKEYSFVDLKNGMEFVDETLIITNRHRGDIVCGIKIGDSGGDAIIKLGENFEKIVDNNLEYRFYKAKEFSIMLVIKDNKLYELAISKTFITFPIESFSLEKIISLIHKDSFSILDFLDANYEIEGKFYDDNRYKAYYKNGLEICEGYVDNFINVYKDYKGEISEYNGENFILNYIDIDSNFARLSEKYDYYNSLFENGLVSPQNSKTVVSNYERSTYYYTKIRYLDYSKKDIEISKYYQNMKWIDDRLLCFETDWKYNDEILIFDTLTNKEYSLKEKFGINDGFIEDCGSNYFSIRSEEELESIMFSYDNGLKLSLEKPNIITNVKGWNHPLKAVLEKQGMVIKKIELINKGKYPIITVEKLKSKFSLQELENILKANGFWDIRIRDSNNYLKIFGDKTNKTYRKVESSEDIFTYENGKIEAEKLIVETFPYKLLEKDNEYFENIYSYEGEEVYLKFFDFNEKGQFEVRVSPMENFLNVYHYYYIDFDTRKIIEE